MRKAERIASFFYGEREQSVSHHPFARDCSFFHEIQHSERSAAMQWLRAVIQLLPEQTP